MATFVPGNGNSIALGTCTTSSVDWSDYLPYETAQSLGCQCETSAELIEYQDGLVFVHCEKCGKRISLARVPGGYNALCIRDFVAGLADREDLSSQDFEMLWRFNKQLKSEHEALEEAETLLELAETLLRKKVGLVDD